MSVRILHGDCRDVLKTLAAGSVQCCVSSPPYFGLRSYLPSSHPDKSLEIGNEDSPSQYVETMVSVFREVWRVLADNGTLFLNIGDSYTPTNRGENAKPKGDGPVSDLQANCLHSDLPTRKAMIQAVTREGFKDKDRMMIPARMALALHADGWWLRDEIVWHKPRPTPHPVKDRTVCAHEMVYMLTKSAHYFYDWAAVEEPSAYPGLKRKAGKAFRDLAEVDPNAARKRPGADREITVRDTRRARSVLSISPSPYVGQHFATMPVELADWCIRAGSREGDTVLDPFAGVGTTGLAADRIRRQAILIELVASHTGAQAARITRDAGLFAEVTT